MSSLLITGTDTNVGKTIVACAIMQALQDKGIPAIGYKPIAFNHDDSIYTDYPILTNGDYDSLDNSDVLKLLENSAVKLTYKEINSYTINHSFPVLTEDYAKISIEKINSDLARLQQTYNPVLVEGTFGWLTPINMQYCVADWAVEKQLPVVLVVGIKEGCINHALLTAQAIRQSGLTLLGWVANRINPGLGYYSEVIHTIQKKIDAPLLAEIPYLYRPETKELGKFITNLAPILALYNQ